MNPAIEHPLCNLGSRRVGGGESDGGVRVPPAEHCGRSLSLMLLELAMVTPYGDPARHTAIVKRCDSALDAVPARPHPRIQLMDRAAGGSSHRPKVAAR